MVLKHKFMTEQEKEIKEAFKLENVIEHNTAFGSAGIDNCNKKRSRILAIISVGEDNSLSTWSAIDPKQLPELFTEAAETCNTTDAKQTFVMKGENLDG
jgi:hypothetical protein